MTPMKWTGLVFILALIAGAIGYAKHANPDGYTYLDLGRGGHQLSWNDSADPESLKAVITAWELDRASSAD